MEFDDLDFVSMILGQDFGGDGSVFQCIVQFYVVVVIQYQDVVKFDFVVDFDFEFFNVEFFVLCYVVLFIVGDQYCVYDQVFFCSYCGLSCCY